MKKIVVLGMLLLLVFVFSSCNDIVATDPTPSIPQSASLEEENTTLSLEELSLLKKRIEQGINRTNSFNKEEYQRIRTAYENGMYSESSNCDELERMIYEDPSLERYHSADIISEIQKDMLVNEVYDILGNPHFNNYDSGGSTIGGNLHLYQYMMYVLEDGRVLVIQYMPIHPSEFEEYRCFDRIPDFENLCDRYNGVWYYWLRVSKVSILTEQEVLETSYQRDDVRFEHSPPEGYDSWLEYIKDQHRVSKEEG